MLTKDNLFTLKLVRQENHLALPTITSLVLVKEIHDVLYQYLVDEEKERLLNTFLDKLKRHMTREKEGNGPFSVPVEELRFLEQEGLDELKYMNWLEIPVYVFEVALNVDSSDEKYEEYVETVFSILDELVVYNRVPGTNLVNVYPQGTV
ncbi:MAG TPA: hypothetical protein GXX39_09595 [Syntrophothermus lipocalidus]|uniref:Uncharacterized protein n=1 Tax=Syntrophothermus lipocalidus (strain DSM 12680 / TGB-C1) TaxID=643648 RepID=D7CJX6_SYNLT|nr:MULTISPECIES: hypothetical protein [Syntrophothermus]ADI01090.1 conserved hypothetical protein [Syntrophothermus lipocalidus DSM 12680]NSW81748.1 hypothetical protein [Syntrophothermus sp.]HHV77599.1 hypothetical protein [Syntrophothermus lipocalidus]